MSAPKPTFEGLPAELRDEIYSAFLESADLCDVLNLMIAIPKYREDVIFVNRINKDRSIGVIVKDFDLGARDRDTSQIRSALLSSAFSREIASAEQKRPTPTIRISMSTSQSTCKQRGGSVVPGLYHHDISVTSAGQGFPSTSCYQISTRRTVWSGKDALSEVMDPHFAERCLASLARQGTFDCSIRKFRMVYFLVPQECVSGTEQGELTGPRRKKKHVYTA